ncbi:hypothetical protein SISSUDRAFT_584515 [Sistotremastrum suecicum HHB10207 ss-3]|uniref:Uncharacterized protein n=1 Tax=Sistotremastrum suecicum HHB10207 ss-3 TaxID=1314776 RepID=A0A165XEM7_9AGAM|nr:hypothetical protein SISSUDRAFT_584515 [Sistotremastrum suecicum HHB10207 ss-3]
MRGRPLLAGGVAVSMDERDEATLRIDRFVTLVIIGMKEIREWDVSVFLVNHDMNECIVTNRTSSENLLVQSTTVFHEYLLHTHNCLPRHSESSSTLARSHLKPILLNPKSIGIRAYLWYLVELFYVSRWKDFVTFSPHRCAILQFLVREP